jgi:hypothetical protein
VEIHRADATMIFTPGGTVITALQHRLHRPQGAGVDLTAALRSRSGSVSPFSDVSRKPSSWASRLQDLSRERALADAADAVDRHAGAIRVAQGSAPSR